MPDSDLNNSPQKPEGNTIKNNGLVGVTNLGGTQNFFGDVNITLTQGYKKSLDTVTLKPVAIFVNVEEQAPYLASIKNSDLLLELVYDPHINKDNPKRLRKLWVTLVQCSGAIIFIDEKLDDVIIEMVILACWLNHTNRKNFNLTHPDKSRFLLQFVGLSKHRDALLNHDKIKSNSALKTIIKANFLQKNKADSKEQLIQYLSEEMAELSSSVNNKYLINSLIEYVDKLVDLTKDDLGNNWVGVIINILKYFDNYHLLPSQFTPESVESIFRKGNFDEKIRRLLGFRVQSGITLKTMMNRLIMNEILNHGFLYFSNDTIRLQLLEIQHKDQRKPFVKFVAPLCINPLNAANIWFAFNNFNATRNIFNIATEDVNRVIHHLQLAIFQPKKEGFLFTNDPMLINDNRLYGFEFLWNIFELETDLEKVNIFTNIIENLSIVSDINVQNKENLISKGDFTLIEKWLNNNSSPKVIFLIKIDEACSTEEIISELCTEHNFLNNCIFCIYGISDLIQNSEKKIFELDAIQQTKTANTLYKKYRKILKED